MLPQLDAARLQLLIPLAIANPHPSPIVALQHHQWPREREGRCTPVNTSESVDEIEHAISSGSAWRPLRLCTSYGKLKQEVLFLPGRLFIQARFSRQAHDRRYPHAQVIRPPEAFLS